MAFPRFLLLFVTAILTLAQFASAQEWTRFRGPNGTGISQTTFPPKFTEKDFAWNITLPGSGHSSPAIWGDKVFVTCTDETTAQRIVLCLSSKTGAVEWKKEFGSHTFKKHGDNSYTSATPAVDADHVYVCWNTPEEFTLMALTHGGVEVWKADLGPVVSQHGSGNSPVVVGDRVFLGDEQDGPSFLFAFDRMTGKVLWKTPRKNAKYSYASPVIFTPKDGPETIVFTSQAEGMTGIDPKTGKVVWQIADLFNSRTVGSPTVGNGLIFATCGEGPGGHWLVAVRPGPEGKAELAWKVVSETPYVPTPLAQGDKLYYWSDRGVVTCAHGATGEKIWQEHVPGSYYSSPIVAGNIIYNLTKKGEVIAIAAGDKFELLGQTPLPVSEKCQASLAVSRGRMYIRTYTHLYCVKGSGGQASR